MDYGNNIGAVACPVCTLFLREGISLQKHLDTHYKEQVIEALIKASVSSTSQDSSHQPPSSPNQIDTKPPVNTTSEREREERERERKERKERERDREGRERESEQEREEREEREEERQRERSWGGDG